MKDFLTRYTWRFIDVILYMLQGTEYELRAYFSWYHRSDNVTTVMKRRTLDRTTKVRLLRIFLRFEWLAIFTAVVVLLVIGISTSNLVITLAGILLAVLWPPLIAYGVAVPLFLGYVFVQLPQERAMIREARHILSSHKGVKIAVVGSYGKTTVKEMLATILSTSKKVAMTPGNMNTPIGISRFAKKLDGDEDILIIEFGEKKHGDVWRLSQLVRPTMAVITGINEAHLESFHSIERTVETIFEIETFLGSKAIIYKNVDNNLVAERAEKNDPFRYSKQGVNGWKVSKAKTSIQDGTSFTVKKGKMTIEAQTRLIGLHTIGPAVASISIASDLGVSPKDITKGLRQVKPFEHRMEPRQLHGAWVVDDTYNGNSDGVMAGLALLKASKATRRIYITPGLVETGSAVRDVHVTMGERIAQSADVVVLMQNSVTDYIIEGMKNEGFAGETILIDDPLNFYSHLDHFIAAGDVVLMQNDWTDNYQ